VVTGLLLAWEKLGVLLYLRMAKNVEYADSLGFSDSFSLKQFMEAVTTRVVVIFLKKY
jgi:hypothetical protein